MLCCRDKATEAPRGKVGGRSLPVLESCGLLRRHTGRYPCTVSIGPRRVRFAFVVQDAQADRAPVITVSESEGQRCCQAAFSRRHTEQDARATQLGIGLASGIRLAFGGSGRPAVLCCAPVIHPSRGASGGTSVARPGGVFTPPHGQDARATHGRCDLRPALPPKICVHLWIKNPSTAKQTNALMH